METAKPGLDLERELSCSICTEVLFQPLTLLDCLHTFCGACLKEWFGFQLNTVRNNPNAHPPGTNPYTCPSCRSPVRDTKHDAKVTTLLEMFLQFSPDKARTEAEKDELRLKYAPGDVVMPKVEEREKSLRERRVEDEDRRLMNDVTALSLRDAESGGSSSNGERRRRVDGRLRSAGPAASRESSRDGRVLPPERERRRRDSESDSGTRARHDGLLRPDAESSHDRRRRRSQEDARRRHEETSRRAARQVEHQSSLRSLISSDGDSQDMQDEILRQIQDEGLLDGVDIDNITPAQQEEIRTKIAEAYLRKQREQVHASASSRPRSSRSHMTSSEQAIAGGSERLRPSSRQRPHARSASQADEHIRRPPRSNSAHLDAQGSSNGHSSDEGRRRRRATSTARSSTNSILPPSELPVPAARVQSDLSDRPCTSQTSTSRPPISMENGRSTTDPPPARTNSAPILQSPRTAPPPAPSREPPALPPRSPAVTPSPDSAQPSELQAETRRAPPPANITVPSAVAPNSAQASLRSSPSTGNGQSLLVPDEALIPAPLSPHHTPSLSERANAMGSVARPISSSGSVSPRVRPVTFPEPNISCNRCRKLHIEYELHYNCQFCANGDWNVCLDCYRTSNARDSRACSYWFGFGRSAFTNWEQQIARGLLSPQSERPHMLTANRYIPPRTSEGGAEGRRFLTTEDPQKRLQSGCFCWNCQSWANHCYWKCDICNDADWGYCNDCVNQGKCCTHPLLPLMYKPDKSDTTPMSPTYNQSPPLAASVLTGPGVVGFGPFKPLSFRVSCDLCHYPIKPSSPRLHCYQCTSGNLPGRKPGDYDICTPCYSNLVGRNRLSPENGPNGWRRCLKGHRMVLIGFQDLQGGQRRVVLQDLVGGRGLQEAPSTVPGHPEVGIQQWTWAEGTQMKYVTTDVAASAPANIPHVSPQPSVNFPLDGGSGMKAVALWSWYPKEGHTDELLFPKHAEIRECYDLNTDWFVGTYMGSREMFPAPFVKIIDRGL